MSKFHVAVLTGRSGSGKSYASEYLSKKGIPTIDSDIVAREVVKQGERCLLELVKEFGEEILFEDGSLNRKRLGDICFINQKKKDKLDSITHPYIIEKLLDDFDELKENGHCFCLVEAAAVIESGLYAVCDKLVLITSSEAAQIERIVRRDGLTVEQAKNRLSAQICEDEFREMCDMVIENDGSIDEFNTKLDSLAQQLSDWFLFD